MHRKKTTDCPYITIPIFREGHPHAFHFNGNLKWRSDNGVQGTAFYEMDLNEKNPTLILTYLSPIGEELFTHTINLLFFYNSFNHKKWFFSCPGCETRVFKLYFNGEPSAVFQCWKCAGLVQGQYADKFIHPLQLKKEMSASSATKKLRALEGYLELRRKFKKKLKIS